MMTQDNTLNDSGAQGSQLLPGIGGGGGSAQSQGTAPAQAAASSPASSQGMFQLLIMGLLGGF